MSARRCGREARPTHTGSTAPTGAAQRPVTPDSAARGPVYVDPVAVVRWLRLWLSGMGRGSMASDVGLTEADCVAVQREIGGWPLPGCPRALAALERLESERRG